MARAVGKHLNADVTHPCFLPNPLGWQARPEEVAGPARLGEAVPGRDAPESSFPLRVTLANGPNPTLSSAESTANPVIVRRTCQRNRSRREYSEGRKPGFLCQAKARHTSKANLRQLDDATDPDEQTRHHQWLSFSGAGEGTRQMVAGFVTPPAYLATYPASAPESAINGSASRSAVRGMVATGGWPIDRLVRKLRQSGLSQVTRPLRPVGH
jgi:hypothetical protein